MSSQNKIRIIDITGSPHCISITKGKKVFSKIRYYIYKRKPVILSFEKIELISLVFLHEVIGRLYSDFDENTIKENLKVEGLSSDDMELLKEVVDNAKRYFNKKNI